MSSIILNVYQNAGVENNDDPKQSLENHAKTDEIQRFSNKKSDRSRDLHRAMIKAEEYTKLLKRGEDQYVFGVFDDIHSLLEHISRSCLHELRSHGNVEFLTETIFEIDMMEKKSILGLLVEKGHEMICVPRSEERGIEIRRRGQHTVHELGNSLEIVESFLDPS